MSQQESNNDSPSCPGAKSAPKSTKVASAKSAPKSTKVASGAKKTSQYPVASLMPVIVSQPTRPFKRSCKRRLVSQRVVSQHRRLKQYLLLTPLPPLKHLVRARSARPNQRSWILGTHCYLPQVKRAHGQWPMANGQWPMVALNMAATTQTSINSPNTKIGNCSMRRNWQNLTIPRAAPSARSPCCLAKAMFPLSFLI